MTESDLTKAPKREFGDIMYVLGKAGLAGLPIVGAPVNELLQLVITPSLEQRRERWIQSVAERLKALEGEVKGFKMEDLRESEAFKSMVMQASQAALRNHQEEKLGALRNAVLNAALPHAPEEDLQLMFLNFVDSFTLWHLRMLRFFNDYEAKRPLDKSRGARTEFVAKSEGKTVITAQKAFPHLRDHQNFYDQVLNDLRIRGLLEVKMTDQAPFLQKIFYAQPTYLGRQLLAFISSPFARQNQSDKRAKEERQR